MAMNDKRSDIKRDQCLAQVHRQSSLNQGNYVSWTRVPR